MEGLTVIDKKPIVFQLIRNSSIPFNIQGNVEFFFTAVRVYGTKDCSLNAPYHHRVMHAMKINE
jgi:hypothetical protein